MNAILPSPYIDPVLSLKKVQELVGYSSSHIYRMVAAGTFPDRVRLGPARVGWRTSAIADWINSRPAASNLSANDEQGRSA